jgi:hypothetical protein
MEMMDWLFIPFGWLNLNCEVPAGVPKLILGLIGTKGMKVHSQNL